VERCLNLHCPSPRMNNFLEKPEPGRCGNWPGSDGRFIQQDHRELHTSTEAGSQQVSLCRRQALHLTNRTGTGDRCTTPKATDPRNRLPTAPIPRVPMAI
jgi:hypothetical protein